MKVFQIVGSIFLIMTIGLSASAARLKPYQKRLLQDKKTKQCFYMESVRKSKKYGWLNERTAKRLKKVTKSTVVSQYSPLHVRKVVVPMNWCHSKG